MGLFDFFSRGSKSKGKTESDPRCDHYCFAHVVLREAAFENPTKCVTSLAATEGKEFLSELWNKVAETCKQHNQPIELTLDDILIHKLRVGPFPCTILEMPAPHFATEAFFVAIILTVDITDQSQNMSDGTVRYLTLENGEPNEEEVQTVIGEWSAEGNHTNLGPGTYPDLSEFVTRITDMVSQPSLPE